MARSSVDATPPTRRLRALRADGTPVYRYQTRPGVPPVSVVHFDTADAHADLPADHRHAHDFLVLVYLEDGAGSFWVNGEERAMRPGELHAVPPGQVVGVGTVPELAHGRATAVAFTPDAVPALASAPPLTWMHHPLLALFATDDGHAVVPVEDRAQWATWLADLDQETHDSGRVGASEAIQALLTRVLVASARLTPTTPTAPDPLVARIFDEIESRFREPVSAGDVARALGYTTGHLTTVLRTRTGRTLLEWITERRMTEVRRLLRETDLPLAVVADRTGLRNAGYLVRRFRAEHGTPPERWRRAQRARPARRTSS